MAGFSSLLLKTPLKRTVTRVTGNLTSLLAPIVSVRNIFTGGGCNGGRDIYGEQGVAYHSNGIREYSAIGNAGALPRPFHHLLGVNQTNKPTLLRVQSMSYQSVADSRLSPRRVVKTEVDQDVSDSSKKENAETLRRHQIRENMPKKDKIKFLVNTLLDIEDNKEAVYGALDAWVACEHNFPIASLKIVIATLERKHQWHRMVQVIKWILSKGQGNTMGTYGQLIRALDMDRRAKEAHAIWKKKFTTNLHYVPWQLCLQMMHIYYRNNMLQELIKLFKDLESYDRKPPDKQIVQIVADTYEILGMLEEKESVLTKYGKKKQGLRSSEATTEDAVDAEKEESHEEVEDSDNHQESEDATEK